MTDTARGQTVARTSEPFAMRPVQPSSATATASSVVTVASPDQWCPLACSPAVKALLAVMLEAVAIAATAAVAIKRYYIINQLVSITKIKKVYGNIHLQNFPNIKANYLHLLGLRLLLINLCLQNMMQLNRDLERLPRQEDFQLCNLFKVILLISHPSLLVILETIDDCNISYDWLVQNGF